MTPIPRRSVPRRSVPLRASLLLIALLALATGASSALSAVAFAPPVPPGSRSTPPTVDWEWPIDPPVSLVEPFRAPPTPYAAGHRGIDLAVVPDASVRAPAAGVVSFAGPVAGRPVLSIDHGDGVVSSIEPVAASVAAGTRVTEGEPIGTVGSGGHCDAACVHFGVRVHGEYVSPMLFLGGVPRAVLLPLAD
jgi:murein DD-endopeptidase MepM/ murein hydrolase activator NlpD